MNYTTKEYAAMAAKANEEGRKLVSINNQLLIVDAVLPTFEEQRKIKLSEINAIYESKSEKIKADTPQSEILTWDIQKAEAEAFIKDSDSLTPFIDRLASSREVDRVELIGKILNKVNSFNEYMAELTGKRQYFEDRIKGSASIEELNSIVWE